MKVSLFGMGYVGAVSGACFTEAGHQVIGCDVNASKVDGINAGASPVVEDGVAERIASAVQSGAMRATTDAAEAVAETDASLVCVGTPSDAKGAISMAAVDAVTQDIGRAIREKGRPHVVILRSTVLPGTTEDRLTPVLEEHSGRKIGDGLGLCFNPEFLREGQAVKDFKSPPFTLVGSVRDDDFAVDALSQLYAGVDAPLIRTTCRTAESVKFVSNAWHGLKVVFGNEVGALLHQVGADAREAMRIFCMDKQLNISAAYLRPGFAFGGSCLPKELRAFQAIATEHGMSMPMLAQVLPSNQEHIARGFARIESKGRKKVALFGLAFKPGTDDLRESPLVALAERLLGRGFECSIYDASLEVARLTGANREFIEREIPHLDRLLAPTPAACLQDAGIIVVGHAPEAAIDRIAAEHGGRPIIDLAGVAKLEALDGADYEGICW